MNDKRDDLWLGFEVGTSAHDARRRFAERFGIEPEQVKSGLGMILAGPVPEPKDGATARLAI